MQLVAAAYNLVHNDSIACLGHAKSDCCLRGSRLPKRAHLNENGYSLVEVNALPHEPDLSLSARIDDRTVELIVQELLAGERVSSLELGGLACALRGEEEFVCVGALRLALGDEEHSNRQQSEWVDFHL